MEISISHVISEMLAPGIMISACGLLLLSMNNKYSSLINSIRNLDREKRLLSSPETRTHITDKEHERLHSVIKQLLKLNFRLKLVRNTLFFYQIAVALFIISSFFIGLHFIFNDEICSKIIIIVFLSGMTSVLIGIINSITEVYKGFEVINIELKNN